jgi:hypothetical protein
MATKRKDIRKTHSPEVEAWIADQVREAPEVMRLYALFEAEWRAAHPESEPTDVEIDQFEKLAVPSIGGSSAT